MIDHNRSRKALCTALLYARSNFSIPHLPNIQIHPLPAHPAPPFLKLSLLITATVRRPICQISWTRPFNNLRHTVPRKSALSSHVHRASTSQPQRDALLIRPNNKHSVAPKRYGYEPMRRGLGDVAVHAECVAGRVKVYDCSFGARIAPKGFEEGLDVGWEGGWGGRWVLFRCPVVLATEGCPAHFLV